MKELHEIKNGKMVWAGINAINESCAVSACDIAGQLGVKSWHKGTMVYLPSQTNIYKWQRIWDFANGVN